ncbi:MAG TPA: nuclease [Chloroflexi bacterium]|nr:nuclease [Chloroflexota bacterium]
MNNLADGCDYIKDRRQTGYNGEEIFNEPHRYEHKVNMAEHNRVEWIFLVLMVLLLAGCVGNRPAEVTPTATRTPDPQSLDCLPDNEWLLAKVVRVVDGDTIIARIDGIDYRVRYIGVDTPETVHPSRPVEAFGKEASQMNEALVGGKDVYLIKDISEVDQYDRLLRYVVADGFFVNYELVRAGYANVVTYPPDLSCVRTFRFAQQDAMNEKAGLWGPRE